jgi:chromosome segregation ATPase
MKKKKIELSNSFINVNAMRFRRKILTLLQLLVIMSPSFLYSQTLDDFRTAASADGVNLIPFPDLRRDATSIADEVQRRKDEAKSFDYGVFETQKNNTLKDIKKKNQEIVDLKKDIDDLKKKYTEIDVTSLEDDVKKREKAISEYNDKIKDMNDKMAKAVDVFDRLYNSRAGLREYFEKALSGLSDAKSNPNKYLGDSPSDDDKKKLEEYINVIQDQIQSRIKDHKDQEEGAKRTKADYESLIKKSEV